MGFTKILSFEYSGLRKEGYLVFTFDDVEVKGQTMYKEFNPVVWKAVHLQTDGDYQFRETYHHQFAFATAQVDQGKVKTSSAVRDIEYKQETTLTGSKESGFHWSMPETVTGMQKDHFAAKNGTGANQNIAVCSRPSGGFAEVLLYSKVLNDAVLEMGFTPRLRIYSVREMKIGSVIKSKIVLPLLWDHALDEDDLPDNWVITEDSPGNYVINPCPQ